MSYKVKYIDKYNVCEKCDLSQTVFANVAPSGKFHFWFRPLQAILREKRGSICLGLQLVEYSSDQTLAYIMEGDRGAGAREKKGVPNEQKNEPENEQEC